MIHISRIILILIEFDSISGYLYIFQMYDIKFIVLHFLSMCHAPHILSAPCVSYFSLMENVTHLAKVTSYTMWFPHAFFGKTLRQNFYASSITYMIKSSSLKQIMLLMINSQTCLDFFVAECSVCQRLEGNCLSLSICCSACVAVLSHVTAGVDVVDDRNCQCYCDSETKDMPNNGTQ